MRGLKTKDIFRMSKILKKMNLKSSDVEGKSQSQVGAELILSIFENLHLAETEVNEFLADLKGMTQEDFQELPISEIMEIIKEFKGLDGVKNFFKRANQSTI